MTRRRRTLRTLAAVGLAMSSACLALAAGIDPAGAQSTLGGFTLSAIAEGATFQYEQPNLPLPATPSVEIDEGYAATSDNYGPTGTALASTLWPGAVLANAGPELALLVPGVPLPPVPAWPIQALSEFPQTPNTASSDEPGITMESSASDDNGNSATAAIGNANANTTGTGGSTNPGLPPLTLPLLGGGSTTDILGSTSSLLGIQALSSTSSTVASGATAVAKGTAIVTGLSLLGGLIYLGTVNSTATASSDGNSVTLSGSTTVTGAEIDGVPITIDANGIHALGSGGGAIPLTGVNSLLSALGITLAVTKTTDTTSGADGSREVDGLRLDINLTDLDKQAPTITKLIPASILSELPVPIPNEQIFTLDLGTVTVKAAASPAFDDTGGGDTGGDSSLGSLGSLPTGSTGFGTTPSSTFGTPSTLGTVPSTGSTTPSTSPGSTTGGILPLTPTAFKGVTAGLVLLGILGALLLMLASLGVNSATEAAAAAACDTPDPASGEGGADAFDPWAVDTGRDLDG